MIMIYIGLFLVMMVSIGVNYPTWIVPILLVLFVANILLQLVKNKNRAVKETLEWCETFLVAGVLAYFIQSFAIQAFKIPSGSMLETLQLGDHLFVNKYIYGTKIPFTQHKVMVFRHIERGDIIVFKYPKDPTKDFVKRAIGLPGDTVEIHNKIVYVNNQRLIESYVEHKDSRVFPDDPRLMEDARLRDNMAPIKVPPNSYFCMGDNRDFSLDSRYWGFMPEDNLKGKAWFIYWPLNRIRIIR